MVGSRSWGAGCQCLAKICTHRNVQIICCEGCSSHPHNTGSKTSHSHLGNFYVKCCGCPSMLPQPLATASNCFSSQQALLSVNYSKAPRWSQNISLFSPKISSLYSLALSAGGLLLGSLSPHICSSPLRLSLSHPTSVPCYSCFLWMQ